MTARDLDRAAALGEQRGLLEEKGDRLRAMIEAVDAAIAAHEGGVAMNDQEMFEVFGDFNPREFGAEAEERWGDTVPFQQSRERAKHYRKDDWLRIKEEADAINRTFVEGLTAGVAAPSEAAMAPAEEHRKHIKTGRASCGVSVYQH